MVILEFYQGDYQKDLATFDSLEEGESLCSSNPWVYFRSRRWV